MKVTQITCLVLHHQLHVHALFLCSYLSYLCFFAAHKGDWGLPSSCKYLKTFTKLHCWSQFGWRRAMLVCYLASLVSTGKPTWALCCWHYQWQLTIFFLVCSHMVFNSSSLFMSISNLIWIDINFTHMKR